jgi:hypothetical protein
MRMLPDEASCRNGMTPGAARALAGRVLAEEVDQARHAVMAERSMLAADHDVLGPRCPAGLPSAALHTSDPRDARLPGLNVLQLSPACCLPPLLLVYDSSKTLKSAPAHHQ